MPAILRREDEQAWLDPELDDPKRLRRLLVPYAAERMVAYPVGRQVNRVAANGHTLIEPVQAA